MNENTTAPVLTERQRMDLLLVADDMSVSGDAKLADTLRALLTSPRAAVPLQLTDSEKASIDRLTAIACSFPEHIGPSGAWSRVNHGDLGAVVSIAKRALDAAPAAPVTPRVMQPLTDAAMREALDEFELVCESNDVRKLTDAEKYAAQEFALSLIHGDPSGDPVAPVAEYDGNHVQNHCTECNEHEAECTCTAAVAADGAPLDEDLTRLRSIALAATPGPWRWDRESFGLMSGEDFVFWPANAVVDENATDAARIGACGHTTEDRAAQNMAFVEAVNPSAILALIDRVERAARAAVSPSPVAADGASTDDLLQLDVLLAAFHEAVWEAGSNAWPAYDIAGKDEAKAIQRHVRAMLSRVRAAVSPATAESCAGMPDEVRDSLMDSQYLAGVKAGWNAANAADPNAALEKIHASRAGYLRPLRDWQKAGRPGVPATPATADERAARLDDADIDAIAESMPGGLGSFMKQWGWRQFARAVEDEVVLNVARASQAAAPAEAIDRYQAVCAAAYQLAGVVGAPLRFLDALSDAANGEPMSADEALNLLPVGLNEIDEVNRSASAPAEAREPVAQWQTRVRAAKTAAWVNVTEEDAKHVMSELPEAYEVRALYERPEPADAGEAVAPLSDQDIYDKFSFLEGLVNEGTYCEIAETAIEIARAFQGAQGGKGGEA
ncbi:hypothetical protein [Burkholderia glumae]|uniref:hypothetical protein n=1 Tax=Burkholderia glumae TaxID=337 RepID=UPI00214FFE2A|nr:hypothetical protein [Burkholderia glumae]